MNMKLLLAWLAIKVVWSILNRPEKAEEAKQKLIAADSEDKVNEALTSTMTAVVSEVLGDVPPSIIEGAILATSEGELDDVLDQPEVKGGIFDAVGNIIGGIGVLLFGKK